LGGGGIISWKKTKAAQGEKKKVRVEQGKPPKKNGAGEKKKTPACAAAPGEQERLP